MSTANLQSCYDKVSGLSDHIQELQQTFNYPVKGLQDSTEIDIKQVPKHFKLVIFEFSNLINSGLKR